MSLISSEEFHNSNLQTTISQIELISPLENEIKPYFLKTTKSGHLYNHPIHTAFNKTNLGSIPSKIETTLIKSPIKKIYSIFNPKDKSKPEDNFDDNIDELSELLKAFYDNINK